MTSNRPYLVRAFYEWIMDNRLTPYILVNAEAPGVNVPEAYIEDGKIIFNISADAVHNLQIDNKLLTFEASFSGQVRHISIPIKTILAIYARENGRGMAFDQEQDDDDDSSDEESFSTATDIQNTRTKTGKPKLTVIK